MLKKIILLVNIILLNGCILEVEVPVFVNQTIQNQTTVYKEPLFLEIAKNFSLQHNYSNNYVCTDFSRDLVYLYEKNNIKSEVVVGYNKSHLDQAHAWVRVYFDIEPQTGNITNFYEYENTTDYQTVLDWQQQNKFAMIIGG